MDTTIWIQVRDHLNTVIALSGIVGIIVTLVSIYWRMRALIWKLHTDNKEELAKVNSALEVIKTQIQPIWTWWNNRQERRS